MLDREIVNRARGIGIILIALGHSKYANALYHDIFPVLYNFHIWIFFFLAAVNIRPQEVLTPSKCKDLFVKSYVPTLFFIAVTSLVGFCLWRPATMTFSAYLPVFAKAMLLQTADALKLAGAGQVYWFLPSYCSFLLMLMLS